MGEQRLTPRGSQLGSIGSQVVVVLTIALRIKRALKLSTATPPTPSDTYVVLAGHILTYANGPSYRARRVVGVH